MPAKAGTGKSGAYRAFLDISFHTAGLRPGFYIVVLRQIRNIRSVFDLIRRHGALASAVHCAFDLLELDGKDLRRHPIEKRKGLLAELVKGSHLSIVLNEHFEEDGAIVFREACRLGCEGIVSKRVGSIYRRGRSPHWVKVKNPNAPAVKREVEEDWR